MSSAGIKRMSISFLTPSSTDFLLVGVIIAKRSYRTFLSKRDGLERGVWSFTLRDSPADYINVTAWGSPAFVESLANIYRVGDVVDITNLRVTTRSPGGDEAFQPPVTSCLELVFNENVSDISLHDAEDCLEYIRLLRLPTKPPKSYLSLADVTKSGKMLSGQHVNLLVAVQKLGEVREVKGRDGGDLHVLEIIVMDETGSGFRLQTWDADTIQRALAWRPRSTVLFLSDVRAEWSSFKRSMTATVGARSVVTENPSTREAALLARYAHTAPLQPADIVDTLANNMPRPDTIVNVMSCSAVVTKAFSRESTDNFTALVYAVVHQFDIDGTVPVITTKCCNCNGNVSLICTNEECLGLAIEERGSTVLGFDLRVGLADQTGTLTNCRLSGNPAASILRCTADEFSRKSQEEKAVLKWSILLKKVAIRIVIQPVNSDRAGPIISIVAIDHVGVAEYSAKVPVY